MKNKKSDLYRWFIQLSRTWYSDAMLVKRNEIKDEVTFGLYYSDGSTNGEMTIRWIMLNNKFVPELRVFNDAWDSLSNMHDLIDVMGEHNDEDITPEDFCELLVGCGFVDITEIQRRKYNERVK